ncbi:hypothetical protein, partial [Klebsiella pneumoniae]|uniref:hypothetical protein n=1 Tax=Klebsiella pneumoniae TaxID=573 RepID=UPI001C5D80DE
MSDGAGGKKKKIKVLGAGGRETPIGSRAGSPVPPGLQGKTHIEKLAMEANANILGKCLRLLLQQKQARRLRSLDRPPRAHQRHPALLTLLKLSP